MRTERRCILLFARSPKSEAIAKRLVGAEPIFERAIRRVMEAAEALAIDLIVALPETELRDPSLSRLLSPNTRVIAQRGGSFGERFARAFRDLRRLGYRGIVAVGSDTPELGTQHLARAFAALERRSIVLGPSEDGGAYLIGARGPIEEGFWRVRWRSRFTLSDLRLLGDAVLLERLQDVDACRDLEAVRALLRGAARARSIAPEHLPIRFDRATPAHAIRGPPR